MIAGQEAQVPRYGLDGNLIDLGKEQELPARTLVREVVEWFIDDVVDELGSRKEVEYAFRILDEGTSAGRQVATYGRTGDLRAGDGQPGARPALRAGVRLHALAGTAVAEPARPGQRAAADLHRVHAAARGFGRGRLRAVRERQQ